MSWAVRRPRRPHRRPMGGSALERGLAQRLHAGLPGPAVTVLVLADEIDLGADQVVRALSERDIPVVRVDVGWFPRQLTVDAELSNGHWAGRMVTPQREVALEDLRSVLYRSPTAFRFPAGLSSTERRHSHHEAKLGVGGVLAALPVLWINHPSRIADAGYKPVQLVTAARCGLTVPATLVTNDAGAARRFATGTGAGGVVTKMLGAPGIFELGGRRVALTSRLDEADLADLRVFLEVNPAGQYGWLEAQTGAPVTQMLADLLARGQRD